MSIVDLRSDTLTRPTPQMRRVMADAEVGDDVWRDDPSAAKLEARAAEVLGKDAALFVPSGTMANQIALLLHCRPGDEVIVGRGSHLRLYESGAGAAWAGVQFAEVGEGGLFDPEELAAAIQSSDYHAPRTRLVSLENTHNRGGGRVWPLAAMRAVTDAARERGLALHLDGARLWNASVALDTPERELAAPFETVSACFSKGLGAPVGSVIAGPAEAIGRALRLRKMLGGGMRQVGILCAAALFALDHHRSALADDHRRARALATGIASMSRARIALDSVETNIVIFESTELPAAALCARLDEGGVRMAPVGPRHVRLVTHLDVDDAGVERALETLRALLD